MGFFADFEFGFMGAMDGALPLLDECLTGRMVNVYLRERRHIEELTLTKFHDTLPRGGYH
jgi:hypothetical protein